jgi:hypothetical protein
MTSPFPILIDREEPAGAGNPPLGTLYAEQSVAATLALAAGQPTVTTQMIDSSLSNPRILPQRGGGMQDWTVSIGSDGIPTSPIRLNWLIYPVFAGEYGDPINIPHTQWGQAVHIVADTVDVYLEAIPDGSTFVIAGQYTARCALRTGCPSPFRQVHARRNVSGGAADLLEAIPMGTRVVRYFSAASAIAAMVAAAPTAYGGAAGAVASSVLPAAESPIPTWCGYVGTKAQANNTHAMWIFEGER